MRSRPREVKIVPTEAEIQKACLEWLNLQWNVKAWRRNVGSLKGTHKGKAWFVRFGQPGMSDIEGIAYGKHLEVEIKRPGKKPTLVQELWLQEILNLGGIAFWVTSVEQLEREWALRCPFSGNRGAQE